MPGPGSYVSPGKVGREGKKYTMSGRTPAKTFASTPSPGPCAYTPSSRSVEDKAKICWLASLCDKIHCSFGKVERSWEGSKMTVVPGPGQYDTAKKAGVLQSVSPSWGYFSGTNTVDRIGTEKRKDETLPRDMVPGPGNYAMKTTVGEGPKTVLGLRLGEKKPTTKVPGPGAYSPNAKTVIEKMPATGMGYGTRGGAMAAEAKKKVPGPGTYEAKTNMKASPKYGFGTSQRSELKAAGADPGPANYNVSAALSSLPPHERSKMKC